MPKETVKLRVGDTLDKRAQWIWENMCYEHDLSLIPHNCIETRRLVLSQIEKNKERIQWIDEKLEKKYGTREEVMEKLKKGEITK